MISVVIPLYNKEQSIASTINSVLAQTYKDFEIVVVNDGSTDKSVDVVRSIDDDRIVLISQKNQGVSAARNTGILAARGNYVAFLDADDIWDIQYLETSVKLIKDYPNAGIYGTASGLIINDIKKTENSNYSKHRGYINNPWLYGSPYSTSAIIVAKSVFSKVGFFDERMTHGEDLDMWWRILLNYPCVYEDITYSYYRVDAENSLMAMKIPIEKHIPYYMDKYRAYRTNNSQFRKFFDREMIYRLYPYLLDHKYKSIAHNLSKQIDYSQLKVSMRFRMMCPHLYYLYQYVRKIILKK